MQLIPGSLFSEIANYNKKVTKELATVSKGIFSRLDSTAQREKKS